MNRQGRETEFAGATAQAPTTFTGNRALAIEEALIFETGRPDVTGVDFDEPEGFAPRLGAHRRQGPIGLPGTTASTPACFRSAPAP
jgi:glycine dehydrogenase subunit 2